MRVIAHGVVWFSKSSDTERVCNLMRDYCSARRSGYQALQRGMATNDARKYVKRNYVHLGQRYINDAVSEASKITQPQALFGGKRAWKKLQTGTICKEDWTNRRNDTLYSRGDRTKKGNPNLRIAGKDLLINDPEGRGLWLRGKLWLNREVPLDCYEVRIQHRDNKFKVTIAWDTPDVEIATDIHDGVIGIDCNPDGVALVETNVDGCLLSKQYLHQPRILFAQVGKRTYDIRKLACDVVGRAAATNKPIVVEKLSFKAKKSSFKRFNRMRHNFLHRQLVEAIQSKARRCSIPVIEVNPAFTSVVGLIKYSEQYGGLNRHTAAALVIARLGMGLVDKIRIAVVAKEKKRVTLEGRTRRIALTQTAFSWLSHLYRVAAKKPPRVTPSHPAASNNARHVVQASSTGDEVAELYNWSSSP